MKRLLTLATVILATSAMADLPKLTIKDDSLTVSGLSAGGYMAAQLFVANSARIHGAGIIAGGPVYCAENSLMTALDHCVNKTDSPIPVDALVSTVTDWSKAGKIDDIANLNQSRVWVLHGTKDARVIAPVTDALVAQLKALAPKASISYDNQQAFAHHFPTVDQGTKCEDSAAPFLGKCDFDAAGEMFRHILPDAKQPAQPAAGRLYDFAQAKLAGNEVAGMADTGYAYVPAQCEQGTACQIHISLHGCNQFAGAENVGKTYVENTGINRWADANNLVVLYPQTKATNLMPFNPQGCWDWWGYTDENYANANSAQGTAILNMANALAGH